MMKVLLLVIGMVILVSCSAQVSKPTIPEAVVKDRLSEIKPSWEEGR